MRLIQSVHIKMNFFEVSEIQWYRSQEAEVCSTDCSTVTSDLPQCEIRFSPTWKGLHIPFYSRNRLEMHSMNPHPHFPKDRLSSAFIWGLTVGNTGASSEYLDFKIKCLQINTLAYIFRTQKHVSEFLLYEKLIFKIENMLKVGAKLSAVGEEIQNSGFISWQINSF